MRLHKGVCGVALGGMLGVVGCDAGPVEEGDTIQNDEIDAEGDPLVARGMPAAGGYDDDDATPDGRRLFKREKFEGNGRTCRTCHPIRTGTLSPEQVQDRFAKNPNGPLFRAIDSDGGLGLSYDELLTNATIRVTLPLPPGWSLADDPEATEVTVRRGIPSTNNVPSLDDIFMYDARFDDLAAQALGAVNSHYEPGRQPTQEELEAIAEFQQTRRFFSDRVLRRWALRGGPPPELPPGETDAEIRGRVFFESTPEGLCAFCHDGPMLNETSGFMPDPPLPPGVRIFTGFVSEFNPGDRPVRTFLVDNADGTSTTVESPDPGRALITGELSDVNLFRTPTLWGSKDTAPYFHDNSAATLEQMMDHYAEYFEFAGFPITEQDEADIIAYLKLL